MDTIEREREWIQFGERGWSPIGSFKKCQTLELQGKENWMSDFQSNLDERSTFLLFFNLKLLLSPLNRRRALERKSLVLSQREESWKESYNYYDLLWRKNMRITVREHLFWGGFDPLRKKEIFKRRNWKIHVSNWMRTRSSLGKRKVTVTTFWNAMPDTQEREGRERNRAAGLRRMKNFAVMDKKLKDVIKMCITAKRDFL